MLSVLSVCRVFPQDRLAGAHELNALKPCSLDQPTGCIHPRDGSLEDSLKSFFFSFLQSLSLPSNSPWGTGQQDVLLLFLSGTLKSTLAVGVGFFTVTLDTQPS